MLSKVASHLFITVVKVSVLLSRLPALAGPPDGVRPAFLATTAAFRDYRTVSAVELARLFAPRLETSQILDWASTTLELKEQTS